MTPDIPRPINYTKLAKVLREELRARLEVSEAVEVIDPDSVNKKFGTNYHWIYVVTPAVEVDKDTYYLIFKGVRYAEYSDDYIAPIGKNLEIDLNSAKFITRLPAGTYMEQTFYDAYNDSFIMLGRDGTTNYLCYWRMDRDFTNFRKVADVTGFGSGARYWLPCTWTNRLIGMYIDSGWKPRLFKSSPFTSDPITTAWTQTINCWHQTAEAGSSFTYGMHLVTLSEARVYGNPFYPIVFFSHVRAVSDQKDYYLPCYSELPLVLPRGAGRPCHLGHPMVTMIHGRPILLANYFTDIDVIETGKHRVVGIPLTFDIFNPQNYQMLAASTITSISTTTTFIIDNHNGAKYAMVSMTNPEGVSFNYEIKNVQWDATESIASGTAVTSKIVHIEPAETLNVVVTPSATCSLKLKVLFMK